MASPRNDLDGRCLPELSLVHGNAESRVPLDVLNRGKVLAHGEFYVGDRDVVAQIDPLPSGVPDRANTLAEIFWQCLPGRADDLDARDVGDRHKCPGALRETELATRLGEQVQRRAPAAGDEQRIAGEMSDIVHALAG